jgi:positive regulator of sigma E activity
MTKQESEDAGSPGFFCVALILLATLLFFEQTLRAFAIIFAAAGFLLGAIAIKRYERNTKRKEGVNS